MFGSLGRDGEINLLKISLALVQLYPSFTLVQQ